MAKLTQEWVHKKHFDLAKKMVTLRELSLHHEMSIALQTTDTIHEFNDIVDKYWQKIIQIEEAIKQ